MPDPWLVLSWLDPDPTQALVKAVFSVAAVVLGIWLVPNRIRRVRRYGAERRAITVTVIGALCLPLSLLPNLVSNNASLMLLIIGLGIAFQPEAIVRLTGGPSSTWSALKAGAELRRLAAEWPDRNAASRNPGVVATLATLESARTPATDAYIDALLDTSFTEPDQPEAAAGIIRLADAEAVLRQSLGGRPSFERVDGTVQ
jgi:hypothetical protein